MPTGASLCVLLRRPRTVWTVTTADTRDWRYLGDCLRAARNGRPRHEVAALSGVSEPVIKRYERGEVTSSDPPDKLWQLANFYRWTPDSISRVLKGPPELPTLMPPALPPHVQRLLIGEIEADEKLSDEEKCRFVAWLRDHTP